MPLKGNRVVGYFELTGLAGWHEMWHHRAMPKRIRSRPTDVNEAAFQMVQRSTAEPEPTATPAKPTRSEISRVMTAMGRKGGRVGGKRRLVTMTPEQRSQVALKAAQARWAKRKQT